MRPLYAKYKDEKINWQNTNGHAGLWFDKFCDQWALDNSKEDLEKWTLEAFTERRNQGNIAHNPKRDWMDQIACVGNQEQLIEANQRIAKFANAYNQSPIILTNNAPFVTGLGLNHPTENGFAWHHSLGTPYLAGSSVKGIVRAFATAWKNADSSDIQRIFGPADSDLKNNKELSSSVGSVIFLDAIPTRQVQLKVDIMTPHYGPYYADASGGTPPPPADWHMPVPIPFLVVAEGQSFSFTILPRTDSDQEDCKLAKEWLLEALEWIGAGAKTAVGYGRMFTNSSADALKTVDELEAENKTKDTESFKEGLRMQPNTIADEIQKLDSGNLAPDVKQTIASYMLDYVDANFKQKQLIKNDKPKNWYLKLKELARASNNN